MVLLAFGKYWLSPFLVVAYNCREPWQGIAEIDNKNVSLYKYSVYEDVPTMNIESDRIDFKNEFSRECIAELSLTGFENNFKYYGFSVLGIKNKKFDLFKDRRIHFNILASHNTLLTFREINSRWRNSVEAFENKNLLAGKINIYNNFFNMIINESIPLFKSILNSDKFFEAIISIFLLFISGLTLSKALNNIIPIIVIIYFISYFTYFIYKLIKLKKNCFSKCMVINDNGNKAHFKICNLINKKLKNKVKSSKALIFSPIALMLTTLHYYSIIENKSKKQNI